MKTAIPQLKGYKKHIGISNKEISDINSYVLGADSNISALDRGATNGSVDQLIAYCKALGLKSVTIKDIDQYDGPYDIQGNQLERKERKARGSSNSDFWNEPDASSFPSEETTSPQPDSDGNISADQFLQ